MCPSCFRGFLWISLRGGGGGVVKGLSRIKELLGVRSLKVHLRVTSKGT